MPGPIRLPEGLVIPASAVTFTASRASGPGGQNVNKVASKVDLRIELRRIEGLSPAARARLEALAGSGLDGAGFWRVTSQRTRDQGRNLEDALDKVRRTVARALRPPRPRRRTRPTAASRERRLAGKRLRARRKRERGARAGED